MQQLIHIWLGGNYLCEKTRRASRGHQLSRATLQRRPSLASDETKGEFARLCLATTVERVMPMMSGSMKVACGAVTSTGASVGAA